MEGPSDGGVGVSILRDSANDVDRSRNIEQQHCQQQQQQQADSESPSAPLSSSSSSSPSPAISCANQSDTICLPIGEPNQSRAEPTRRRPAWFSLCWANRNKEVEPNESAGSWRQRQERCSDRIAPSTKPKESQAIQVELARIKMHEKLLLNGQQKLISQLEAASCQSERDANGQQVQIPFESQHDEANSKLLATQIEYAAIECRNLSYKTAVLGAFQKTILHNVNLTVPEASIYGLLGPSGCGKTTLLRCVAGRLKPAPGSQIKVFGFQPNEPVSQIPGPAIGYMPQEISIYEEFTINETLTYFGRINQMNSMNLLNLRIEFLIKFLNLPPKKRLIKTLSGGQKRRVSLAIALIHSPPLLILDEPTVGVDPLLRQVIWNYLTSLAQGDRITIIITTHYIEEARQANIVGLMRNGRLLAQNTPLSLMQTFQMNTLERVFLKLCIQQSATATFGNQETVEKNTPEGGEHTTTPVLAASNFNTQLVNAESLTDRYRPMARGQKYLGKRVTWRIWIEILMAVVWKNYLRLKRNPAVLVFEFLLPAFQIILFCLCIGGQPFDIPLAIVNEESVPQASSLFLNSVSNVTFIQVPFASLPEALDSVRSGKTWAAVHIPSNYTKHLKERFTSVAGEASSENLINSTISIYPDLSNLHLALAIENSFKEAFMKFARRTLETLGYSSQLADLPIQMGEPVYGRLSSTNASGSPISGYLEFMAPGVLISITYVMATGLTALAFILEKRDGLLERSQVCGVGTSQMLLAHALLQVFVMVAQIGLVLAVTFYIFQITSQGPFILVILLILLQGCTGTAFGLLISAVCSEENGAIMMLVGTFYINLILAGILWPIEAMPYWLRICSFMQPQTLPIISLRNIMARGWSIDEPSIQLGFLITLGWLIVFLIAAGLCMRFIK